MDTQVDDGLTGLTPVEKPGAIGKMPNAQHQKAHAFLKARDYELAIVEFDDQGRCYDRRQMDAVTARLDALRSAEQDAIVLVFVHGWKHDARSDDANLTAFRSILVRTARHERLAPSDPEARPVLGIFVGWRGLSEYGLGDTVANATFWGRQAAGLRVATGSVRELFGRLRHYRNHRLKKEGAPLLVITGHSFGGMIVYSALAQSLIEAASSSVGEMVPSFADLVLLINPAIEAARYLPIYDLVSSEEFKKRQIKQLPVFICAQAENDQPVGTWFPMGNIYHEVDEATIGDLEKDCLTHALGFVPSFRTHKLSGPVNGEPFVLDHPAILQPNPFWIVGASKDVIDGHGGIWQQPFADFLASVLFQHVRPSGSTMAAVHASPLLPDGPAAAQTSIDLAAYAKTIKQ